MLGEDSGLEVEALGGAPGIRSARYAPGEDANAKLLEELRGVEGEARRARYVCELVLIGPEREELRGTGIFEGRIAEEPRGTEGFGYDPVFIPDGEEQTVAELGNEWKSRNSHRAKAAQRPSSRVPVTVTQVMSLFQARPAASSSSAVRRRSISHQFTSAPKTIKFAIT